uniref:Solute carrier family 8 member B1 n=1 Tax=Equus asinus asinus TaxID=83772 RepID=A0A8C4LVG7_EQUAS
MAGRRLHLPWVLSLLGVLLMVETALGARGPSTGAHLSPQFPASGVNQTAVVDCRDVCGLNASDRCAFIRTNPDCHSDGGYLDYLDGIFCHFPADLLPLAIALYALWLLYLFLILGVTAEKFFCPNLSAISTTLRLSHNVAVSFLAFSDPRTAGLALGALFGAGVLVTTVVAGGIAILRPFTAASRPFLRDIIFYMVAVFLTFTRRRSLVYSMPGTPEMLSESEEDRVSSNTNSYDYGEEYRPLLFSQETTVQILIHGLNPLDYRKWRSKSASWRALKVLKLPVEFLLLLTVPVMDPDKDDGNWKRPLNCLHLVVSPLVLVLTLQSGACEYPLPQAVSLLGAGLGPINTLFPPQLFAFLGFLTSALWINAAATEVVNILRSLGVVFRLSNTVLGLTLLAWGNSIGDVFSDFTLARQGYPRMAYSACFGGIIFNILVGVGLGCLLQISRGHTEVKLEPDGLLVWVLAGALGLSLVCSLVSVPLQCFQLSKAYGLCLLLFYVSFLIVALLTEFGVIHLKSV